MSQANSQDFDAEKSASALGRYHRGIKTAFSQGVIYAVLAGKEITEAKKALPHGKFRPWLEKTGVSKSTAHRYKELYDALKPRLLKCPSVGHLIELPAASLSQKQESDLAAVVHKATGGAALNDLFIEHGITKDVKPFGGNHGGDYGKQIENLPLDEQLKLARKAADEDLDYARIRLEDGCWMILDDPRNEALLFTLEAAAKAVRKWLSLSQKQRAAHAEEIKKSMRQ